MRSSKLKKPGCRLPFHVFEREGGIGDVVDTFELDVRRIADNNQRVAGQTTADCYRLSRLLGQIIGGFQPQSSLRSWRKVYDKRAMRTSRMMGKGSPQGLHRMLSGKDRASGLMVEDTQYRLHAGKWRQVRARLKAQMTR